MGWAVSLSGAAFALLCFAMVFFVLPVGAHDGGIPPGTAATEVDTSNSNDPPDVAQVAATGCTVSSGASITLEDGDGTQATLTDGKKGIVIFDQNGRPRIEQEAGDFVGDHATFPTNDKSFDTDGDYAVVSSTGITGCRGGNAAPTDDQYTSGDVNDADDVIPGSTSSKQIPDTGGPPLLVFGALLLCAAVVVGQSILRS